MEHGVVGLERLELSTSRLSGVRSSHLSYRPLTYIFSKSFGTMPSFLASEERVGNDFL